jgi:hypothetical protein
MRSSTLRNKIEALSRASASFIFSEALNKRGQYYGKLRVERQNRS